MGLGPLLVLGAWGMVGMDAWRQLGNGAAAHKEGHFTPVI